LVSCTVGSERRTLVFRFTDPTSLVGFQLRMRGRTPGIRYEVVPGRVDTLVGVVTATSE